MKQMFQTSLYERGKLIKKQGKEKKEMK